MSELVKERKTYFCIRIGKFEFELSEILREGGVELLKELFDGKDAKEVPHAD